MKPSAPVRSSSPASILAKTSSNAPEAAICAATSAPLLGCSSATRSIVVLSDGPSPYTENLTPPADPAEHLRRSAGGVVLGLPHAHEPRRRPRQSWSENRDFPQAGLTIRVPRSRGLRDA